jgi:IclR family KDG regulon transcriptional repressor
VKFPGRLTATEVGDILLMFDILKEFYIYKLFAASSLSPMQHKEQSSGVKSALRVLDIFELLAQHPDGLNLSEISAALGIPKSSAHGLLMTLIHRDYLRPGRRERTYRLGVRLFELGASYMAGVDLVTEGQEIVRETSRACDETVHLAVLEGAEVLYIAKEEGTNTIRMVSAVGRRFPAHGTGVGKMMLSALPAEELDRLYPPDKPLTPITSRTITDPTAFRAELAEIRQRGYATDFEESTPGLCCIAAPIFNAEGATIAAMSVSVPTVRFTAERQLALRQLVLQSAERLSRLLGYRPKAHQHTNPAH